MRLIGGAFTFCLLLNSSVGAQTETSASRAKATEKIIIDTDIGGDIDDAFAVGLALRSPELQILGISSAWGDTHLRARLLSRFLKETGGTDIPVAMGITKHPAGKLDTLSQAAYAEGGPRDQNYPNAVDFLLDQIRLHPGEITLIAIGPETNLGAAIDRDAATFRKLKRIVLMGGSVYRGYSQFNYGKTHGPDPEWNILCDIQAARKVFTSGVPLYVMPLDSDQTAGARTSRNFQSWHGIDGCAACPLHAVVARRAANSYAIRRCCGGLCEPSGVVPNRADEAARR